MAGYDFLRRDPNRKESVHRDFSNAILRRKMWLKKQHYKAHIRFGGQIQAVHFSGILNCRRWTSRKRVDFYRSPGFEKTKALCM